MRETTRYHILSGEFDDLNYTLEPDLPVARIALCKRVERTYLYYFFKTSEIITEGFTIMVPQLSYYSNDFGNLSYKMVWNRMHFFHTIDCAMLALEEINKGLTCHLEGEVKTCR